MKTPITYWGGKQKLASLIISLIPEHTTYCEPFFGGGAVFFRKPPSKVEIINDLNRFVINFYRQAKTNFPALQQLIQSTPHSRRLWRDAFVMYQHPHLFSELDLAWAFYTVCNQGFGARVSAWGFGTRDNSCEKKLDNQRDLFIEDIRDRLNRVQIECNDALYLLKLRDTPESFFYLDPPYINTDMGHYDGYTEQDFEALLQMCSRMKGRFLLSTFPTDILDRYTRENGWDQIQIRQAKSSSASRKMKIEVLTANFPIAKAAANAL